MAKPTEPTAVKNAHGVNWWLRGVTWCALVVMLAAAGLPSTATDRPDGQLSLLSSTWEDASTLEAADTLDTAAPNAPVAVDDEVALAEDLTGYVPVESDGTVVDELEGASLIDSSGAVIAELDGDKLVDPNGTELATLDGAVLYDSNAGTAVYDTTTGTAVVSPNDGALLVDADGDVLVDSTEYVAPVEEVVTDNLSADEGWIADLNGWVPNLGTAIGFSRGQLTGSGIDIALIDSGITPVAGLDGTDKVINGPDLSADAGNPALANLDLFGHGTHMAGIIAGNDGASAPYGSPTFTGIAPGSRLVNLKVADGYGNTSPEQVVAAIEWAILHRNDAGLNIRVLALALGHDETNYQLDPIAGALEAAWDAGIVVVVAGGNKGITSGGLDSPAIDPYVISVAGADQGDPFAFDDDAVASFSSSGNATRTPEILVPGRSIVSLRVPGSWADTTYPESAVGARFAVASGTSQATAVLSGAVALILEDDPSLSPDQIKHLLTSGAKSVEEGEYRDGEGRVRVYTSLKLNAYGRSGPAVQQFHAPATVPPGFGTMNGGWSGGTWSGGTWSGGTWSGGTWSGGTWSGGTWSGATWSGATWSGGTWSGVTWSGATWSGATWSGGTWSGGTWS